jgi:hypothetical protein
MLELDENLATRVAVTLDILKEVCSYLRESTACKACPFQYDNDCEFRLKAQLQPRELDGLIQYLTR